MSRFTRLFRYYFNLDRDKDDEAGIIASITRGISFRGSNLWTLVFAVIIASVGLNVNSPAVIIGAMLISPLMGPIMGVGLGIAIADFELVRRGAKNLTIAVIFSICTSGLYFLVTPLHNPTSELLARTTPTIWDVLVALSGGFAGIVGATRREKGNVIPGVAIATALMPPLCTAGYGIANGMWYYVLGAFYLFFINSVFICTATVLVVRFMGLHRHSYEHEAQRRRVSLYIVLVVTLTAASSVWLAYRIVRKAVFESEAARFVAREMAFPNTQVVNSHFTFDKAHPKIEVLLMGEHLDSTGIDSLQHRLPAYGLAKTELVIRQGLNAQQELDFAQIKAAILNEAFAGADSTHVIMAPQPKTPPIPDLTKELTALFPRIYQYSLSRASIHRLDGSSQRDSTLIFVGTSESAIGYAEQQRISRWLKARLAADTIQLFFRKIQAPKSGPAPPADRS